MQKHLTYFPPRPFVLDFGTQNDIISTLQPKDIENVELHYPNRIRDWIFYLDKYKYYCMFSFTGLVALKINILSADIYISRLKVDVLRANIYF